MPEITDRPAAADSCTYGDGVGELGTAGETRSAAVPWRQAMTEALYAPGGFYARGEPPSEHFRTSVHAGRGFAAAVLALLERVDAALDRPDPLDLVDLGAGRGELLHAVVDLAADADPKLHARLRPTAVEAVARPPGLATQLRWTTRLAALTGLLVANEWLDDIPLGVVQQTDDGPRLVLVDRTGAESLGPPPTADDIKWLARWWPLLPGERGEVGRARDEAWGSAVRKVRRGVAVAVDYAHSLGGRPPGGTLAGYRAGRRVPAVPDGSCNLTAHVALDACAAAGVAGGATATLLTTQRAALHSLGVTGRRPPLELAHTDPTGYVRALAGATEAAELTDPAGLGGFGWLIQGIRVPLPVR